jgi:hypothetical protein
LSRDGKIAIGTAIPLTVLLVIVALCFIFRRRKRLTDNGQGLNQDPEPVSSVKDAVTTAELQGSQALVGTGQCGTPYEKPELDATNSVARGSSAPSELAG